MVEVSLVYGRSSDLVEDRAGRLTVALATPPATIGGRPVFFDGWVAQPRLVAALLLSIGAVARARYFQPASPRLLDPILTSGDDRLRIEAFSSCCGVYARADLQGDQFQEASIAPGTTNVDLGQGVRDALVRGGRRGRDAAVRRRRWGPTDHARRVCGGTQGQIADPLGQGPGRGGVGAGGYASSGGVGGGGGATTIGCAAGWWFRLRTWVQPGIRAGWGPVLPGAGGRRCAVRGRPDAAAGTAAVGSLRHRSSGLGTAGQRGTQLRVGTDRPGWPGVVRAQPRRGAGVSGEGTALDALSDPAGVAEAVRLRGHLGWRARLDEEELAGVAGTSPQRVRTLLAVLGSQGLVGRDLAEEAWFRRDLPFAERLIPNLAPRVRSSSAIAADDVDLRALPDGTHEAFVRSGGIEHRAVFDGDAASCTCSWYLRHAGSRGPCRHVLAARARLRSGS